MVNMYIVKEIYGPLKDSCRQRAYCTVSEFNIVIQLSQCNVSFLGRIKNGCIVFSMPQEKTYAMVSTCVSSNKIHSLITPVHLFPWR